ncbi:MAG: tetratricopeptide repeat protein [Candidatus Obscuribacterales bacterium]|nr:tetratricopeptide repeat protein [Candidatus Obscuribacterales bacterium]
MHNTLSVIHVQRGEFDKAMEHVDAAIAEKDKMPDAHLIKGVLHYKKGEKDLAMKELDVAIKQKEKNAEARNTKADILFSSGKVDEALAEYKNALKDDPKYHQALIGISNILIQRQQWQEALDQLHLAQELKPEDANTIYSIAICLEKLGKPEMAIPKFNEGILVDSNVQTRMQIQQHVRELQQRQFLNVPGLINPVSGDLVGPGSASQVPGSGLFGAGSSFFSAPFKDLIKIKAPGEKEDKKAEKSGDKKTEKSGDK